MTMEQHPVPQNITSFQFRLIGDMTIKQFGYLAGGVILAYISYKLPLPFFFTWPMAIICALTGFGFAFVPVEERPMDIWFFSFLKNVYNPTVFHWEHTDPPPEPPKSLVPPPLKIPFLSVPAVPSAAPAQQPAIRQAIGLKPTASVPGTIRSPVAASVPVVHKPQPQHVSPVDSFFSFIDNLFITHPKMPPAYVVQPQSRPDIVVPPSTSPQFSQNYQPGRVPMIPTPTIVGKRIPEPQVVKPTVPVNQVTPQQKQQAESSLNNLKTQLEGVQKQLSEKTMEEKRFVELQRQLTELMAERQKMENELIALRSKAQSQPGSVPQNFRPAGVVHPQKQSEPTVKTMNPDVATRAGLPRLTTFPNVVTGIIKDYDNNLLPGVLVTVKDKDGVPLRALKTNKLGQFAASTQLSNGTYVVEVEDPRERFLFDRVQITVNGAVMPALQIVAKSKRSLDREKLVKEIFGSPNASV
jgi:hypothetical protein